VETVVAAATILSGFFCFFAAVAAETIADAEAAATTKRAVTAATLFCSTCFLAVAEAVTAAASNLHTKAKTTLPCRGSGEFFAFIRNEKRSQGEILKLRRYNLVDDYKTSEGAVYTLAASS